MYPKSGGDAECKDTEGVNCAYFKRRGYCTQEYVWYMTNNCGQSCEFCGGKLMKNIPLQIINKESLTSLIPTRFISSPFFSNKYFQLVFGYHIQKHIFI